ncbi:MAG: hypothetical protein R3E79_03505 [Caldilineaceae bacterium]
MAEKRSFAEKLSNRLFGIPVVAQLWAKLTASRVDGLVDLSSGVPFARRQKSLAQSTVALLTTGGIHLVDQQPF